MKPSQPLVSILFFNIVHSIQNLSANQGSVLVNGDVIRAYKEGAIVTYYGGYIG